jgi:hypothetical protein
MLRRLGPLLALLAVLPPLAWVGQHARYHSWHPCDWLLQEEVDALLRRQGVDPATASIVLRATAAEHPRVRAVLRLRNTPAECLVTWAAGRVLP